MNSTIPAANKTRSASVMMRAARGRRVGSIGICGSVVAAGGAGTTDRSGFVMRPLRPRPAIGAGRSIGIAPAIHEHQRAGVHVRSEGSPPEEPVEPADDRERE